MLQLILLFLLLNYSHHLPWDYEREGPDTWPHTYDECEGEAQSPIDIRTSHVKYNSNLSPRSLNGWVFWSFYCISIVYFNSFQNSYVREAIKK
jgi:hypothetical protein